jgi:hypothetical protein
MSQTKRKNPKAASLAAASKKPLERHVVLTDGAGTHQYSLSPDALGGLFTELDQLPEQGWLPALVAYEVLKHFEVKPDFRVLDELQAHYEEDKGNHEDAL